MAEPWWRQLGAKLVDAGQAYVQQVALVQRLRAMTPDEARAQFAAYVEGLSSAARAGFTLTLSAMAQAEQNPQVRQFIDSLRGALANPSAWAPPGPSASPAPAVQTAPDRATVAPSGATAVHASFEDDLKRVHAWHGRPAASRSGDVTSYLAGLDDGALAQFQTHVALMCANVASQIEAHRANEQQAWGGSIEDRIAYGVARIRTGEHDPRWVQQLQEFESFAHVFDEVRGLVAAEVQRRAEPAPATGPSAVVAESPSPVAASGDAAADPVEQMRAMLREGLAGGQIRADRRVAFERVLDSLQEVQRAHEAGELSPEQAAERVRQMFGDVAPQFADPGGASRRGGLSGRAAVVDGFAGGISAELARELMAVPPAATQDVLGSVLGDARRVQRELQPGTPDEDVRALESSVLRPAARRRHNLAMTRHALLARPLWDCAESVPAVNTVFYAGASDLQAAVERVGSPLGLTVDNTKRIQQYGQVRWDSLRACHVAVFDLRGAGAMSSLVTSDPRRARELAGAAYELGLAFALGSPVVVVTAAGDRLPFDVDVAPVEMEGDEAPDGAMLTQAIDEAFYVPQRRGSRSSIGDTLAALDTLTRPHERRAAIEGMGWVSASLAGDPAGFGAACDQVFRLLPGSGWALLRPSWPGAYASEDRRQCFHVMPFGPAWADGVRDAVREVCGSLGLAYRRGDEAEEGRIIHAIWDDICRAQVVVVDLTGANLNVLIELGIAHATGRPVIAVEQRELPGARPKNIEKFRVLAYDSPDTLAAVLRGRIPGVLTPT